jgi:thymidylate kinase
MLITFSGLDGAGKTTLIGGLRDSLQRRGRGVVVLHLTDHVGLYAYLRWLRDRTAAVLRRGSPRGPHRPEPGPAGGRGGGGSVGPDRFASPLRRLRNSLIWSRALRRFIYPVDLLIFQFYRLYAEGLRGRVLIMDRYFYDTLVDVSDGRGSPWVRLLWLITPTPSLPIFLGVGPEESYARKGEYSVEYLRRRWTAYQEVFAWVDGSVRIANESLDSTREALEQLLCERITAR